MKRQGLFAALCAACALFGASALALDLSEVKTLVANNVDEAVIIAMVQQGGRFPVTTDELDQLRSLGASETLISALMTAPAPAAPPVVYYEAPQTVVTTPPTVYYAAPPAVVYPAPYARQHYFGPRPGISLHFGFGDRGHRPYRRWRR